MVFLYIFIILFSNLWCISNSSSVAIEDNVLTEEFNVEESLALLALKTEASQTGEFRDAWRKSSLLNIYQVFTKRGQNPPNLVTLYRQSGVLNMAEIRILISYCIQGSFFPKLNADCRENGLNGGRYPQAKRILNGAIHKLHKYQEEHGPKLPDKLYRNEPAFLYDNYAHLADSRISGNLTQFTSTSRLRKTAVNTNLQETRMVITFENPKIGADVDDFSVFDEYEILLPVNAMYTVPKVEKVEKFGVVEYTVALNGPYSNQDPIRFNIYLVTMCFIVTLGHGTWLKD